jgi:hypothetical protein
MRSIEAALFLYSRYHRVPFNKQRTLKYPTPIPLLATSPPPLRPPNQHPHPHSRSRSQTAHDRDSKQALPRHLIVNQRPQTLRLQIPALQLQQTIIVPPGFGVVS